LYEDSGKVFFRRLARDEKMQDFRLISRRTDPPLAGADQPLAEARDIDEHLRSSVSSNLRSSVGWRFQKTFV